MPPPKPRKRTETGAVGKSAALSDDEAYRWQLGRTWDQSLPTLGVVMLNPSTADAYADDPTIRRVVGFARSWGHGSVRVCNLFGLRATQPQQLWLHPDPVGPMNGWYLQALLTDQDVGQLLVAWGGTWAHVPQFREAAQNFVDSAKVMHRPLVCLERTKSGHPVHPLYQPKAARALPWPELELVETA